jgi:energy-coupling factor transport system substrate-specific component
VGVLFVIIELAKGQIDGALFAVTMITSGLIWGYGIKTGLGRTLPRFIGLSAVVAVATSALAVPITVLYLDGNPGRGYQGILAWGTQMMDIWAAVGLTNLSVSIVDKVFTGVIALFLVRTAARIGFMRR